MSAERDALVARRKNLVDEVETIYSIATVELSEQTYDALAAAALHEIKDRP